MHFQSPPARVAGGYRRCRCNPRDVEPIADDDLKRDGKYLEGPDVSLLVGSEMPSGQWQTVSQRATDCYWELTDGNGKILDNAMVSVAPRLTLTINATATGFTTHGCGDWRWVSP